MMPKIKEIKSTCKYKLEILFDDGKKVLYDVSEDMKQIADFKDLEKIEGLWQNFNLDESRTCIFWNDRIDLPSDAIYEYGKLL